MAIKFYELDDESRICVTAEKAAPGAESPKSFDFPEDFDFFRQHEYKFIDGKLTHAPLPEPEQPEDTPSQEERIAELEEALDLLLSGVTE